MKQTAISANAVCRSVLADGRVLTITASRRPRANRADVKCSVAAAPALAQRMQQVVRMARLTEAVLDTRDQVVLSMDLAPAALERDWELAAVLADRMARGVYTPADPAAVFAFGSSDVWHLGRLRLAEWPAHGGAQPQRQQQPALAGTAGMYGDADPADRYSRALALLGSGGVLVYSEAAATLPHVADSRCFAISHLGALQGHADQADCVASVRTWFPLYSGGLHDSLAWVEVSVYPLDAADATCSEEDSISAPQLEPSRLQALRQTLAAARHFDGHGLGRWRTLVRFGQPDFQGASYELALVMADRMARGREFLPRGRLIASGQSSAWHAGQVETVDGQQAKLELIIRQAGAGDRVLLPADWSASLPAGYQARLRQRGASLACISRIGMI
ncbi:hypothetical protein [Duganella qianjiadongensis]|uniref:Uncharacterized protein n=1 Tax=Duganella qianjiadongensis TaxID=2692176 RepID=A0ABW9VDR4_9BURK|nr:hypothetical protein [Duganella qianjiadongensis]MYM37759.1 hypothetical protein [Duganella qianjiadongensis]